MAIIDELNKVKTLYRHMVSNQKKEYLRFINGDNLLKVLPTDNETTNVVYGISDKKRQEVLKEFFETSNGIEQRYQKHFSARFFKGLIKLTKVYAFRHTDLKTKFPEYFI